jgi:beta-glucanase (GH16 family)
MEKPLIQLSESLITTEDVPGGSARFIVYLSDRYDETVTVTFNTSDSSAVGGINFSAVTSGTVTFKPGERSSAFTIPILHDTTGKEDLYFKVKFSNPVNAILQSSEIEVKIINIDYNNLLWSDEFNGSFLNLSSWNYEQGNNNGWGNNELEVYTNSEANVHVDSGYLHITALNPSENSYTSGRITTLGKKEFTYGRIEIRARLPYGKGIWPALWMLGSNIPTVSWPKCGEIDIMENIGHQPNTVYGTLHWDEGGHKYRGGNTSLSSAFSDNFHLFTLIWTPNSIKWLVDNQQYYSLNKSQVAYFPFDLPQFFIFNVAVGGNWPGNPDNTTVFPQHMIVDYVRVYQ